MPPPITYMPPADQEDRVADHIILLRGGIDLISEGIGVISSDNGPRISGMHPGSDDIDPYFNPVHACADRDDLSVGGIILAPRGSDLIPSDIDPTISGMHPRAGYIHPARRSDSFQSHAFDWHRTIFWPFFPALSECPK